MRERVRALCATVFELDVTDIPEDASTDNFPADWDSLRHLELMLEVELAFDVRIPTETIPELDSIPAIVDYLETQTPTSA
ncbi:MAG: acyl carrier protein [Solirubrobacteraceae bacterium]